MQGKDIVSGVCSGCTACKSICPANAINFEENRKGFLEPVVDQELCIECEMCKKTCNSLVEKNKIQKVMLVKHKDNFQHTTSQSGGAFVALSDTILKKQGSIFGVIMDENLEAKVAKAKNFSERDLMRGSKYMQARVEDAFIEVEKSLKQGLVLYTGTPCQIGGLIKYLNAKKIDMRNLYTIDLICHGTPSVKVWRETIKYISKDIGNIKYAVCRDKIQTGWGGSESTFYGNKKISTNIFCKIFFTDLCLRDSCYKCQYTTNDRISDLTIGDAWGVKEKNPEFYDPMGVSIVCINSKKGQWLYDSISEKIDMMEVSLEKYAQKNMSQSSCPHRNVEEFWDDFNNKSFEFIKKKYGENNIFLNYKYVIKKAVGLVWKKR